MNIFKAIGTLSSLVIGSTVKAASAIDDVLDTVNASTHGIKIDAMKDAGLTQEDLDNKYTRTLTPIEPPKDDTPTAP